MEYTRVDTKKLSGAVTRVVALLAQVDVWARLRSEPTAHRYQLVAQLVVFGALCVAAMVFDHAGSVRAAAQREFRQIFPQPGWVEHDAVEIWDTQLAVAREALAKAKLSARGKNQ